MPIDFLGDDFESSPTANQIAGRDFLGEENMNMRPQESFGTSAALALPRIGTDIAKGAYQFGQKIPEYFRQSKTEIPGALNIIQQDPMRALRQGWAGLAELGQNVFNTPHDLTNYFTNRLNLIPENINQMVQMSRMPSDTSQMINEGLGEAKEPGEALLRGLPRNALNIIGGSALAKVANPMRFTSGGIAKNVLKEEAKQIESHSKRYNNIWDEANKTGFNQVPIDKNILNKNLDVIEKYKTPKEFNALKEFIENPTLEKAQRAQSDMGVISRALEKKSRTSSLLSEEKSIYDAAKEAEKHIEGNMFKNENGNVNNKLKNQYDKLTESYRENVVPYRYNPSIQAFKNKDITAKELVNSLSRGSFAAKKGSKHPSITINNLLKPSGYLGGIGLLSGAGLLGYLSHDLLGKKESSPEIKR